MTEPGPPGNAEQTPAPYDSPVTLWLRQLEVGDAEAAQPLYQHFCTRLHQMARLRIPANVRSAYDQDDVTISAIHSLFLGIRQQKYQLNDRDDVWRLLMTIAERKITKRIRYETRDKRDVRRLIQNSLFQKAPFAKQDELHGGVQSLTGYEPTPEFAAEVAEACENLLASLPDEMCRRIALLKLENYTSDQVAEQLGCTRRTVQRKLLVIRRTWQSSETRLSDEQMSHSSDERALDSE